MHNAPMYTLSTVAPAAAACHRIRVYFEDTDAAGIVYYANYLKFMERARTEWLRDLGLPHADLVHEQFGVFVVLGVTANYLAPARLEDLLDVRTAIHEMGRASLTLDQWVVKGDQCLVTSQIRLGYVDTRTLKPKRIPQMLVERLAPRVSARD
ncbi:tol-pal system-associated acyl-CoA thioesterase [Piscinibacterium candidicorallinum]|uniref:Tol-pal system-associated acyl-CoA thioesterase n=1 Tax=Piscinibacterium candidicorallinum TaxID=1793872 RepID=A0ABV7H4L1_9BURK